VAEVVPDIIQTLGGPAARPETKEEFLVLPAESSGRVEAYRELRRDAFVTELGLFDRDDADAFDADPLTRVLVAVGESGAVLGGVRVHPDGDGAALGWWRGSRLVVDPAAGPLRGRIGAALVRAACSLALDLGAIRFDAHVQLRHRAFFARLGWEEVRAMEVVGEPHLLMRWPVRRFAELAAATKAALGPLLAADLAPDRWRGDDGVPVPGSGAIACVDAIVPSMVERDPEWAGWCGMLVTAHDLGAMGARPLGALDALGAGDAARAARVLGGLRAGAEAFDLPILGGHTQLGVPGALAVTGLGAAEQPIPASGARPGDALTLTADLRGGWRRGYRGRQWDSTSGLGREELTAMLGAVAAARPRAAKDVSMAGIVGTAGMLAEASGCGIELEVAAIPRPRDAELADWLTCFPGFAVLTADAPGARPLPAGAAVGAECGRVVAEPGVRLRWPDGEVTSAYLDDGVTGLGAGAREEDRWVS
jgi:putative N-acetyltransferase (TIGR04045 family)